MELLENFMWKPRGFRETRVFESHGSWPSQASACGRAALGRLAHPLVGVIDSIVPGVDMKRTQTRMLWENCEFTPCLATLCEIPSDYSGSLAKMASLDIVGVFCALGESS